MEIAKNKFGERDKFTKKEEKKNICQQRFPVNALNLSNISYHFELVIVTYKK